MMGDRQVIFRLCPTCIQAVELGKARSCGEIPLESTFESKGAGRMTEGHILGLH